MTTKKWKLEKDLCRCCHAEGTFRSLAMSCEEMDGEELCSDILRDCFNIDLAPIKGQSLTTYTICDECINRLGDAFNFKKQVMRCEERFQQMYGVGIIEDEVKIDPKTKSKLVKNQPLLFQDVTAKEWLSDNEYERPDNDDRPYEDDHPDDDDGDVRQDGQTEKDCILMESLQDKVIVCIEEDASMEKIKEQRKHKPTPKKKSTKKATVKKEKKPVQDSSKQSTKKEVTDKPKISRTQFKLVSTDFKRDGNKYVCAICDKTYSNRTGLYAHIKVIHYKLPRWTCDRCDTGFNTLTPYVKHKYEVHQIDKLHKCKACDAVFVLKLQLQMHLDTFHKLGEKWKCHLCDYETIGSRHNLEKHMVKHKTTKDFVCRFCKKTFLRQRTLTYHERIHTGDRRKVCRECGQAFVQKASLNYHMAKYHPEVPF